MGGFAARKAIKVVENVEKGLCRTFRADLIFRYVFVFIPTAGGPHIKFENFPDIRLRVEYNTVTTHFLKALSICEDFSVVYLASAHHVLKFNMAANKDAPIRSLF